MAGKTRGMGFLALIDAFYRANANKITKEEARELAESLLSIIANTLARGEGVAIYNFGLFRVHHVPERSFTPRLKGQTGITVRPEHTKVLFKAGKGLFNLMNPHWEKAVHHGPRGNTPKE